MTSPKKSPRNPRQPDAAGRHAPGPGAAFTDSLLFPPETAALLRRLQRVFATLGTRAYLVGGAVRDALLGRRRGDLDLAVDGPVRPAAEALAGELPASLVVLDARRGIYRIVLRESRAHVDLTPLRGSVEDDARLRDFTINALAAPLESLEPEDGRAILVDPTGGLEDLRRGQVRAVAPSVYVDDGGRLLRTVRLAAEMGLAIEPGTQALLARDAHRLELVAAERVRDEFCRILDAPGAAESLLLLDRAGLLTRVLPDLEASRDVAQPREHYWNVLRHAIEAVRAMERVLRQAPAPEMELREIPWDAEMERHFQEPVTEGRTRATLVKLAALLHDVAKPATRTIEPGGRIRFLGHPIQGAEMAGRLMERLRFSSRERRMVVTMVKEHLRPGLITRDRPAPTARAMYRYFRDAGEVAVDTLMLSFADYLAARGPLLEEEEWREYAGRIRGILERRREEERRPRPVRLLTGHDLMHVYQLEPGPLLGTLLEAVEEAHAAGEIATREDALALVQRLLPRRSAA